MRMIGQRPKWNVLLAINMVIVGFCILVPSENPFVMANFYYANADEKAVVLYWQVEFWSIMLLWGLLVIIDVIIFDSSDGPFATLFYLRSMGLMFPDLCENFAFSSKDTIQL